MNVLDFASPQVSYLKNCVILVNPYRTIEK